MPTTRRPDLPPAAGARRPRRLAVPAPGRDVRARWAACLAGVLLGPALAGCAGQAETSPGDSRPAPRAEQVAPPLAYSGSAWDLAGRETLAVTPPQELPGLHNVYRLSDNIVSGSEPHGEEAFEQLAAMGVRTILSVDGKVPDAESAARHGLKYVHIPIQYRGIAPRELAEIAKTFRELPGPFYVHCFHGKHRGPAAAAVGRLILDGAPREEALAEMRQWCGTGRQYEGLFRTIADEAIPDAAATARLDFDFPAAHPFEGVRGVMVPMPRAFDALQDLARLGWAADPQHPDLDPVNEAVILHGLFEALARQDEERARHEDFGRWRAAGLAASAELAESMRAARAGLAPGQPLAGDAKERVDAALAAVGASCKDCHAAYRDS